MKSLLLSSITAISLSVLLAHGANAQETKTTGSRTWTEIGAYVFVSQISGDTTISNVTTEVDVPVSDLLENLDFGAMAFIEHRDPALMFVLAPTSSSGYRRDGRGHDAVTVTY